MASSPRSGRGLGWPGAIGIGLSVLLLWWALRDVHLAEVAGHLRSVRLVPFVAMVVVATLVFPLRTVRWRYLLRLDGEAIPFVPLWHATAIGFMANNLLPARTGEVARAYAARRLTAVKFSTAAATLVVERVMDGLTLVALLAAAAAFGGFAQDATIGGIAVGRIITVMTAMFLALLAAAVVAVHWPNLARSAAGRLARAVLPTRWADRVTGVVDGLLEGLEVLQSWRRFGAVALWSLVVWGVNGLSFWLCIYAFDLQVPWTAALVLQSLIAFGVALPQSPGYFGMFEAATRATLVAYGTDPGVAVSYAVGYHITTFIPITLLGLWSLARAHLHLADLGRRDARDDAVPAAAPSAN